MNGLLNGIRVVEMGTYIVVPKAARMLADWGADVIKVDLPNGEYWRHYAGDIGLPGGDDNNVIFQTENVNKRCISMDLKQKESVEALLKLLEKADVFMCNLRNKSLKKLSLDYESLKEKFPRLIFANFTGYGEEGEESNKPGYDTTAYWSRNGSLYGWTLKGNYPFKPWPGFGDSTTAPMLASGILAALYQREKTGKGDQVIGSLLGSGMFYNSTDIVCAQFMPRDMYPMSRGTMPGPTFSVYRTADDNWVHFSLADWEVRSPLLLKALGMEEFIDDERFATFFTTVKYCNELVPLFEEAIVKMTAEEFINALEALDIICAKLEHPADVSKDKQAWANGLLREVQLGQDTKVIIPNTPIQFGSKPEVPFRVAPMLGEHSVEILLELGYTNEDIQEMLDNKTIIETKQKAAE